MDASPTASITGEAANAVAAIDTPVPRKNSVINAGRPMRCAIHPCGSENSPYSTNMPVASARIGA